VIAGIERAKCEADRRILGTRVESSTFAKLSKLAPWNADPIAVYHSRDRDGVEVYFILKNESGEAGDGALLGAIELL